MMIGIKTIVVLILAALAFVIFIPFIMAVMRGASEEQKVATCLASATFANVANSPLAVAAGAQPRWNCDISGPRKITMKDVDKEVKFDGLPQVTQEVVRQKFPGIDSKGEPGKLQRIKYNTIKIFVEELKRCYIKTGMGELDIFPKNIFFDGKNHADKNVCGLCASFYFDDEVLAFFEKHDIKYFGHSNPERNLIITFMQSHPHQARSAVSYWEYLDFNDPVRQSLVMLWFPVSGIENMVYIGVSRQTPSHLDEVLKKITDVAMEYTEGSVVGTFLDWSLGYDKNALDQGEHHSFYFITDRQGLRHCAYIANDYGQ